MSGWVDEMSASELRAMEKAAGNLLADRLWLAERPGHTPHKSVLDKERAFFEDIAKYFADQAAKKE